MGIAILLTIGFSILAVIILLIVETTCQHDRDNDVKMLKEYVRKSKGNGQNMGEGETHGTK